MELNQTLNTKMKSAVYEGVKEAIIVILIYSIFSTFITTARVSGNSMEPTFSTGDIVLVNRLNKSPDFGDIVVVQTGIDGGVKIIKRVVGVENDRIEVIKGQVLRNGMLITEDYIKDDFTNGQIDKEVPEGKIFIMGDNRLSSLDSRFEEVGCIEKQDILGKVIIRIHPRFKLF